MTGYTGGVNIYDEKRHVTATDQLYILLSTQQQVPIEDNDSTWISRNSIDIEVYQRTGSEVSKNRIDDVANMILARLIPSPGQTVLASSNLQFGYATVDSIISRNLSLSETESVIAKVIRFTVQIVQQGA